MIISKINYVYWIHLEEHKNPYVEGYIGISINPNKRFKTHSNKRYMDNYNLYHAITKLGAKLTILHIYNLREDALNKEEEYRPVEKIGWNIIPGGISPPSRKGLSGPDHTGLKHSNETKILMSEQRKGNKVFTNGIIEIRAKICPEGFYPGKKPTRKKNKKITNTSKMGKGTCISIHTPYGIFSSISEASKQLNISWDKISYRIYKPKFKDWYVEK